MNNCLYIELKKQAQNSNLPYLGNVNFFCEVREGLSRSFIIETDVTKTHDLNVDYGDLVFKKGDGDIITQIIPPNGKAYYKESTVNSKFHISEKYHIVKIVGTRLGIDLDTLGGMSLLTQLNAEKSSLGSGNIANLKPLTALTTVSLGGDTLYPNNGICGDIQNLATLTNLTSLKLRSIPNITGNISYLNSLVNLTTLEIYDCSNVSGNIQSLGNLTSLTSVDIKRSTSITGDALELVKNLCSNNKTTGTLTISTSSITVGETTVSSVVCTWDSANSTVTITNNAGTTTYAVYHWDSDTVD